MSHIHENPLEIEMRETTCFALKVKRPSSLPTVRDKTDVFCATKDSTGYTVKGSRSWDAHK